MIYKELNGRKVKAVSNTGNYGFDPPIGKIGVVNLSFGHKAMYQGREIEDDMWVHVDFPDDPFLSNSWYFRDLELIDNFEQEISENYNV